VSQAFFSSLTLQSSYVFSKPVEIKGDSSTDRRPTAPLRNERLDKRRLSFDRTHVFKVNGIYELLSSR